jgi:hypothetical protein
MAHHNHVTPRTKRRYQALPESVWPSAGDAASSGASKSKTVAGRAEEIGCTLTKKLPNGFVGRRDTWVLNRSIEKQSDNARGRPISARTPPYTSRCRDRLSAGAAHAR